MRRFNIRACADGRIRQVTYELMQNGFGRPALDAYASAYHVDVSFEAEFEAKGKMQGPLRRELLSTDENIEAMSREQAIADFH